MIDLLHMPEVLYLLTRCAPRMITFFGFKTARMLYQFEVSVSAERDGGFAANAIRLRAVLV